MSSSCVGDSLFGKDVFEFEGHHYHIIGGSFAALSWHQAAADVRTHCFNGKVGHLVHIGSEAEDAFITQQVATRPVASDVTHAWIGATDMCSEGEFEWVRGAHDGEVFYKVRTGADTGKILHWAPNEPNGIHDSEDCVLLYVGSGLISSFCSDEACSSTKEFFVVDYGL